jgi:hypothetical protein
MAPPEGVQFDPAQQRLGSGVDWGVQVSPAPHPPMVSQRQPRVPTMHVEDTPAPGPPLPELEAPEEPPPELENPLELPLDPDDASSLCPNRPGPPSPGAAAGVDDEPPQAHIAATTTSDPMIPRPPRDVRSVMTLSSRDKPTVHGFPSHSNRSAD